MVRVGHESLWFILLAADNVLIYGSALKRLEAFGEVVGIQEALKMVAQLLMRFIVIAFHHRLALSTDTVA